MTSKMNVLLLLLTTAVVQYEVYTTLWYSTACTKYVWLGINVRCYRVLYSTALYVCSKQNAIGRGGVDVDVGVRDDFVAQHY